MAEVYSNLAETTTTSDASGAINNTTDPVTFTVNTPIWPLPVAAVGGPNSFRAVVDTGANAELLLCQRTGNMITATRAQEGTVKVAHAGGVPFAPVLTASALAQFAAGGGGGGGAGVKWQEADYTIYFDGTNYSARNERTQTVDFTSNTSVHNVFNSAATALGTGTTLAGEGGLIVFSTPSGHVMQTSNSLVMQNQLTVRGPGRGCIIQAKTAGNWSAGTLTVPIPMIDAYLKSRVKVEGLSLDCAGLAGTTGMIFEKGTGNTGGNDAHSYFLLNEVRGFTVSGIQVGRKNSAGATSTCWIEGNQVVDDVGSSAVGVGFYVGDAHYGWGNNIKMSTSNGYPMYINADSVHVMGESHMVNNSNCPHALVTIVGGGHTRIQGIYFDNLRNFGAVDINTEGSGASNRVMIIDNWCHLQSPTNFPSTPSVFRLNAVNGGCSGVRIAGNTGEADAETTRFTSIVGITNGSANDIQNSLAFYGNSFQHVNAFITADNGPTTGAGSCAVGVGQNMIEDSNTGGGSNGSIIRVGP